MMENVKVALVHDWLTGQRGGEKVLEVLAELYPEAPIFTLFHFRGTQAAEVERRDIRTSFLQKLPFLRKKYRSYLPLFPLAAEMFDLQEFGLVLSSSHCVAKGIIPHPEALHISYIHSPVRYAWNHYFSYFSPEKLNFFSRLTIPPSIHRLRIWDVTSSARVDYFIANSRNVASRIEKYYRRPAEIIHPPVDTDFFQPADSLSKGDFYLIVSALVPYKRLELAISAFNKNGLCLKIVGAGPDYRRLKKLSQPQVEFLGSVDARDLRRLYQTAQALILPGEEDFGISALEAQACGTPVIAYGGGGALETIIPGETGILYPDLTAASLGEALDKFRSFACNRSTLRSNAMRFSRPVFKETLSLFIRRKWSHFKDKK